MRVYSTPTYTQETEPKFYPANVDLPSMGRLLVTMIDLNDRWTAEKMIAAITGTSLVYGHQQNVKIDSGFLLVFTSFQVS